MKAAMVMIALAGCSSLRGKGDAAYAHGDYAHAAELYDQAVKDGDRDAVAPRTRARAAELRAELYAVQLARAAGYDATGKLAALLDQRDAWGGDGAGPIASELAFEVAAASARIGAAIAARTEADGPLAGEDLAQAYRALLAHADLASARQAIDTQLLDAGRRRCARLVDVAATPYWQWLAARYCGHWGVARAVPALPDQRAALAIDGDLAGATADELSALRGALQAAFATTAWFAPTGTGEAHARIDGSLAVAFTARDVTLTASWTDQVPYTDYETTQESYQEPYDDTETYDEQVPTTEYVPCGDSTCPQTVYHTETRTRTVTRYRTAWRDVTTPVTRYRDVPRTQDYQAVERSGSYASALRVIVDGVVATVETQTTESGRDHDVTIEPAGVAPERANLTTHEQFAAHEAAALADRMVEQLDRDYVRRFCGLPAFTLEQAAECAYAGARELPRPALDALAQVLGGEVRSLRMLSANTAFR